MPLNISTNTAALRAGSHLAVNQTRLQRSFDRLASGKKLSSPIEDPGGLAVSMKLSAAINRYLELRIMYQTPSPSLRFKMACSTQLDGLLTE